MHDEKRFIDSQGRVTQWPSKRNDKLLVLAYLATKFEFNLSYTEAEVNELLKRWHTFGDWPLLRRELYNYKFLDRNLDGSDYRLFRISTTLSRLFLVSPNIETDPLMSVGWLDGPTGRETLRLMGNTDEQNKPSTLADEQRRVREFITATDQSTWSLNFEGKTVGAVWVDHQATDCLPAPSVHIMIGDSTVRGRGIGSAAVAAVIALLKRDNEAHELFSRYLVGNLGSEKMQIKLGFTKSGDEYRDKDGLVFQNMKLSLASV